jgi:beta-aspartyl-peptidase (threonine type)
MGGQVEMDAAMMSGRSGAPTRAGAVSSATRVRNPIKAARKVLGDDRFVLLTADGADDFAEDTGQCQVKEGPD